MKLIPGDLSNGALFWLLLTFALLFFIVGHPETYKLVNHVFDAIGLDNVILDADGHVTNWGVAIHAVVFALLLWLVSSLC